MSNQTTETITALINTFGLDAICKVLNEQFNVATFKLDVKDDAIISYVKECTDYVVVANNDEAVDYLQRCGYFVCNDIESAVKSLRDDGGFYIHDSIPDMIETINKSNNDCMAFVDLEDAMKKLREWDAIVLAPAAYDDTYVNSEMFSWNGKQILVGNKEAIIKHLTKDGYTINEPEFKTHICKLLDKYDFKLGFDDTYIAPLTLCESDIF
jgi:hypothetical protein